MQLSEEETSSDYNDSSLVLLLHAVLISLLYFLQEELLVTSVIRNDRSKVKALLNARANPNYVTVRLQYYNRELQFKFRKLILGVPVLL